MTWKTRRLKPQPVAAPIEPEPIDVRADERARVIARIRRAAINAVPQASRDWLDGFDAGVQHMLDAANADDQI